MKFKNLLIVPVIVGATALVGCSNESAKQVNLNLKYLTADSAPVNTRDSNAQAQIAEASTSVSQSLQSLSAIQMAKNPGVKMPKATDAGGLSRRGSLNWNGPVQSAVARVASAAGYKLRVLGRKPSIPVIINVNASNQTLGTILRNITFQAEPGATIVAYPSARVIELRYNQK